ncbi:MAG: WbqC family protein [Bacteroidaceae bacterium]
MSRITVCLSSAYLPPVSYFCCLMAGDRVLIDSHEHYVKQTYRNRANIASSSGLMSLTIPVEHGRGGNVPMCDLKISEHGNWRHLHWQALQAAYDKSPFFEYYADDFWPFYEQKDDCGLFDYNLRLQELICSLIGLDCYVEQTSRYVAEGEFIDLRNVITPKSRDTNYVAKEMYDCLAGGYEGRGKYYQVFAERNGFLPDLSIVDLLFNMGPESLVVLNNYVESFRKILLSV